MPARAGRWIRTSGLRALAFTRRFSHACGRDATRPFPDRRAVGATVAATRTRPRARESHDARAVTRSAAKLLAERACAAETVPWRERPERVRATRNLRPSAAARSRGEPLRPSPPREVRAYRRLPRPSATA